MMKVPWHGTALDRDAPSIDVPDERYFFIHVMKTGGRTLGRHFRGNFELDEVYPYGKLDIRYEETASTSGTHLAVSSLQNLPAERVRRIKVYSGHFPYVASEMIAGDFTRFTVLREPVERPFRSFGSSGGRTPGPTRTSVIARRWRVSPSRRSTRTRWCSIP